MEGWSKLLVILYMISFASIAEQATITISTIGNIEISERIEKYLVKSYSRLGYKVHFLELSPGRASILANDSTIDGLSVRVQGIEKEFENLIRVPVLLTGANLALYCAKDVQCDESVINEKESIIGGVANVFSILRYMKEKKSSLYLVNTHLQLSNLFEKGRLKYIFSFEIDNLGNFQNLSQSYNKIYLTRLEGYHYVNKKHADIVPELVDSLNQTINEFGAINQVSQ
jgi:hypothetical protein